MYDNNYYINITQLYEYIGTLLFFYNFFFVIYSVRQNYD